MFLLQGLLNGLAVQGALGHDKKQADLADAARDARDRDGLAAALGAPVDSLLVQQYADTGDLSFSAVMGAHLDNRLFGRR